MLKVIQYSHQPAMDRNASPADTMTTGGLIPAPTADTLDATTQASLSTTSTASSDGTNGSQKQAFAAKYYMAAQYYAPEDLKHFDTAEDHELNTTLNKSLTTASVSRELLADAPRKTLQYGGKARIMTLICSMFGS